MTTFKDLFEQYAAIALDKQWALSETIGDHAWSLDLDRGTLSFGQHGSFPIQILGTESDISSTWLWAWANTASNIPPPLLRAAQQLRDVGERERIPELTTAQLELTQVDGHQLALVASGLLQSDCYYSCPYEGGAAFVLLDAPSIRQHIKDSPVHIIQVFNQLVSAFLVDHRNALTPYLQQKGFAVTSDGRSVSATRPDGSSIKATFDAQDRLIDMSTTVAP